ncbi:MAG: HEAT repeat domain-containing protein [Planctomycetota bacterium]|nr:HEAT repeat domain-containing protein [Planctomycetota bacterium]
MTSKSAFAAVLFAITCLPLSTFAATDISELITALGSDNDDTVENAIEEISHLGPKGAPAVPALVRLLRNSNPHIRAHAAIALGRMRKAAIPAVLVLARMVTDPDADVRHAALDALAEIEPGKKMVVPLLLKALRDKDNTVVKRAVHALAERGKEIVPAMIEALKDDRTEFYALLVLHEIGPDAKDAVPAICDVLHEANEPYQRQEAAMTLGMIGPGAASAVPDLITLLDDPEIGVQHAAVFALGMIGPPAAPAAESIREHLDSDDPFFWVAGAWALAKIFPENKNIKKTTGRFLAQMITNPDHHVRRMAAQALLDLKPGGQITLPALEAALTNSDEGVVNDALIALNGLGEDAIPVLIKGLDYPAARTNVAEIIQQLGPAAIATVPALLRAYQNETDVDTRTGLLFALAEVGPKGKEVIDLAIKGSDDEDEGIRYASFYVLGQIGPDAKAATDVLKSHLDDEDQYYAATAAWALARIDEDDPEVVAKGIPLFIAALKSPKPFVRHEAADSLAELGPLAKPALAALQEAAKDHDPSVAEAAQQAIQIISGNGR